MTQKQIFNLPIGSGQYTEQSERGAVGRWYDMDKVRFRKGLAEKIGGWIRLEPQFLGTARRLRDWSSLDGKRWAAIATDVKLYLWQDSTLYDITPLRRTVTLTAPFTTQDSPSLTVTVADVGHGAQAGDYVTFSGAIAGGSSNILVDGEYVINSVPDQDTYTITVASAATGPGAAGEGGTPTAEYQISAGAESVIAASGYGTGPYGAEGYGNARTGSTLTLGIRTWSLDTWGEDLLASPRGGAIYWWDRSLGTGSRATALTGDAPQQNEYMIISQRDRHVISLGAYDYFNDAFDPLLIRWGSTEDLNDWIPTATNTSGDLRLYSGSKIVTGVRSRLETVIFTDVSVHTLPFVGGFDVFGLNIVGENVSILGPNAAVPIDHRVIFMAEADFYIYDGIVKVLDCDVRNLVYDNLNTVQRDKVYTGLNREFNEVWFYYPSYDINAWIQQDFSLGLPPSYSVANASNLDGDLLFDDVMLMMKFDGSNADTAYTEIIESDPGTFYGDAQLDSAVAAAGTTSLVTGLFGGNDGVQFGDNAGTDAAWQIGANDEITLDVFLQFNTLPGVGEVWSIVNQSQQDVNSFDLEVTNNGGVYQLRIQWGFGTTSTFTMNPQPSTGVMYHVAAQRFISGSKFAMMYQGVLGNPTGNYLGVLSHNNNPSTLGGVPVTVGSYDNLSSQTFTQVFDGNIDSIRMTRAARYSFSSYTIPDPDYPEALTGGAASIGYLYAFNSGGYAEVVGNPDPPADNNYEHDLFLVNDEPILTPTTSEYAVELDVNPSFGGGFVPAGLCFLRTDLVGAGGTDADDAQEWMFELDYDNNRVQILKKETTGLSAPDNLGTYFLDFTTATGTAMALGQKYVLKVQFDTPTITCWVDDTQVFQFNMSVAELALFTTGTTGLHQRPSAINDAWRFYNFAAGPIGTITDANFDISPIEVNRYACFNYEEGTWSTGQLARTAWADRSPLLEKPYAAGTDGYLYQHETGTDDNGAALPAYIESFDMEIPSAGEELMHVDQLIPDFLTLEGSVDVYLTGRKYPQDPNRISKGPYTVASGTRKLSTRIRARQIAIRVESSDTGDMWRMGNWRGRAGPHGKRG